MENMKKATCPLDCFDLCLMDVTVGDGEVVKVSGDKNHPLTCGALCKKGLDHVARHNDRDRLKNPMIRQGKDWFPVSVEKALEMLADKLTGVDTKSVLYYTDSGHNGLSKSAASIFFGHFGPITTHRGSLCWDAGNYALKEVLGECIGVHYEQIAKADTVVLWGRNAKDTNVHLHMHLKRLGKKVVYIDPITTATAKDTREYYQVKPNSDLILAAGLVKILQAAGKVELSPKEKKSLDKVSINQVCEGTGLSLSQLEELASHFQGEERVITYIGYGLQRYRNGAKAVEGILRLHFLSGNVNKAGCGFHFSDKRTSKSLARPYGKEQENITFVKSKFGKYVQTRNDLSVLFVDKSNPLVQLPNTSEVEKAIRSIPFKVGMDLFLTDTMKEMDLVFPAPSVFECQDVVTTSMFSPYLQYTQKCMEPAPQVISEYRLFQRLAKSLGVEGYPKVELDEFLYEHVKPVLEARDMSWEEFQSKGWLDPMGEKEKRRTFVQKNASMDVFDQILTKEEPAEGFRLITPHGKNSLHSQGYRKNTQLPTVYMNREGFETGDVVSLRSSRGILRCQVEVDANLPGNLAYVYEGYWRQSGIVNAVTTDEHSDHGEQAAYYETFVAITKE